MLEIRVTAVPPAQADGLSAAEQVDMALGAIGFRRDGAAPAAVRLLAPAASIPSIDGEADQGDEHEEEPAAGDGGAKAPAAAPRRRGRPRKDEQAVAAQAQPEAPAAAEPERQTPAAEAPAASGAEEPPQIRANPEERAEQPVETKKLTHEDLRDALGRMSKKLGLKTAVEEIRALLGGGIQDVPDTQEALGAALEKLEARIAGGPAPAAKAEPAKTHDDVKAAIVAYAKRYGQDAAKVDWKVATGHSKVDDMPNDAAVLGKAVADIMDAVEANPFGRARVDA